MAAGNPVAVSDAFGEQYLFWTDGVHIYFSTNLRATPINPFDQAVADAPIDATIDQAGLVAVTYLDADGNRQSQHSHLDGDSGSWS